MYSIAANKFNDAHRGKITDRRCRGIALNVICDIQPLQNTRVFPYLEKLVRFL